MLQHDEIHLWCNVPIQDYLVPVYITCCNPARYTCRNSCKPGIASSSSVNVHFKVVLHRSDVCIGSYNCSDLLRCQVTFKNLEFYFLMCVDFYTLFYCELYLLTLNLWIPRQSVLLAVALRMCFPLASLFLLCLFYNTVSLPLPQWSWSQVPVLCCEIIQRSPSCISSSSYPRRSRTCVPGRCARSSYCLR